jgi:hypothetical protein
MFSCRKTMWKEGLAVSYLSRCFVRSVRNPPATSLASSILSRYKHAMQKRIIVRKEGLLNFGLNSELLGELPALLAR